MEGIPVIIENDKDYIHTKEDFLKHKDVYQTTLTLNLNEFMRLTDKYNLPN